MSSPPRRHNPPTYEEDRAASPNYVYDEEENAPDYDDRNYADEDPNPGFAEGEQQETDEDMARMHQREEDAEVAADAEEHQGDIDAEDAENDEVPYDEQETYRRNLAERESGFHREQLDSVWDVSDDEDNNEN
jgi:hypothetical protein